MPHTQLCMFYRSFPLSKGKWISPFHRINPHDPRCLLCKLLRKADQRTRGTNGHFEHPVRWKKHTLVSSSIMLCCSRTWSLRKAISWSSWAWSRSFRDFSFFSGGWELIFSFWGHTRLQHPPVHQTVQKSTKLICDASMTLCWPSRGSPWPGSWVCPPASGYSESNHHSSYSEACSCPAEVYTASPTLELASAGGDKETHGCLILQRTQDKYTARDESHTNSFLSSTSSEFRSSNLRIVELSSAMRLWFLLRSWKKQKQKSY